MKKRLALIKNNNRGAGIVTAIIASVFVLALAVVVLTVTYTEFQIRSGSVIGKSNSYDSSTAMEEIKAGVQNIVSEAINSSYTKIMSEYAQHQNSMKTDFTGYYVNYVKNYQSNNTKLITNDTSYNGESLHGLVTSDFYDRISVSGSTVEYEKDSNNVVTAITLKSVTVKCTYKGRESTSIADIKIKVPDVGLVVQATPVSEKYEYAIVSTGKIIDESALTLSLSGSIYSKGLENKKQGTLNINTDNYYKENGSFICAGGIDVIQGSSTLNVNSQLWAENINVGIGSNVSLLGKTYVYNDLNLNGTGACVTLEGEYYGFGTSTKDSSKSSAILINAKKTTLDMSDLTTLNLAGLSYIGSTAGSSSNVITGGSISVKSDEQAYLVPVDMLYAGKNMIEFTDMLSTVGVSTTETTNSDFWAGKVVADFNDYSVTFEPKTSDAYLFESYEISCKPNTKYTLSFDVEQLGEKDIIIQCYIFAPFDSSATSDTKYDYLPWPEARGYVSDSNVYNIEKNGTNVITFTTGSNASKVRFRVGTTGSPDKGKVRFSNISLYKSTDVIDSNPMIYSSANDAANAVYVKTDEVIWTINNKKKTLADYNVISSMGSSSNDGTVTSKKIVPVSGSQYIVYYYMSFKTTTDANNYFKDYFNQNNVKLQSTVSKYVNLVSPTKSGAVTSVGSIYAYTKSGAVAGNYSVQASTADVSALKSVADGYKDTYENSCKLPFSKDSEITEEDSVFDEIVKKRPTNTTANYFTVGDKQVAVVVKGNYTYDTGTSSDICLIIADGDVTVNKDFNGLIICTGNVNLYADVNCNGGKVSQIGKAVCGSEKLSDYFTSGSGNLGTTSSNEGSYWEIASLVEFSNEKVS